MRNLLICGAISLIVFALIGCNPANSNEAVLKENVAKGEVLFKSVGCTQCHSLAGQTMYGPALNNVLNSSIQVIRDGKEITLTVDREYILRSIQNPDYEKLVTFDGRKMPKIELSDEQINQITDYLISVNQK